MSQTNINIGKMKGDFSNVSVSGDGNIVGHKVRVGEQKITKLPPEYRRGMEQFTENLTLKLTEYNVPQNEVTDVQKEVDDLTEEVDTLKSDKEIPASKKRMIGGKIAQLAERMARLLPSAAETASLFTPLAPFSKLIGESVEEMVNFIAGERHG